MSKTSRQRDVQRQTLFSYGESNRRLIPEAWADTTKETVNKREENPSPDAAGDSGLASATAPAPLPDGWEVPAQQTPPDIVRDTISP